MNPPETATVVETAEAAGGPRGESEELISGSEAIAHVCRLADVDVITAYPIRPYDTVMQYVSQMISNGDFDCEYIVAESEHSQFEIVKHASAVGARVFVGSSGVGWFYAFEALAVTAGLRLPMVAMVGNRALDDPGAFGVEHNDALAVRDLGWMLAWVDTAQEALDTALIAYRVAEDRRVSLPCAISCDGAFLTHSQTLVKVPSREMVDGFLPPFDRAEKQLHPDNPITIAPQANEDWLMEMRRQNDMAARRARDVLIEAYDDLNAKFGRGGEPFIERYMMEDAEVALVGMGTLAMPVKVAVRKMRAQGRKVGFVRVRWFRPFPRHRATGRALRPAGRGGHRSRLLRFRLRLPQRRAGQRAARGTLPGEEPAQGRFVRRRPGRTGGEHRQRHRNGRPDDRRRDRWPR